MTTFQETIQSIKDHLSAAHKRKLVWLACLILLQGVLDVFGLGLIIPIIKIASEPSIVANNLYHLGDIFNWFGFTSINAFTLFIVVGVLIFYIIKLFLDYL